ncbi:hypothetical protein SARC_01448 [Sphaeroforma arctica JP610]|uniref:Fe2OG dioxygenase domain-containing protein n=1 Tax=Sphaeroforma arctica JP610 TaxID=667725 RepID=A0A0L0GDR1_9EUKA|nr:hypothetical protein SARC_01448 [Sphaeroforma arctica JP610]KNC86398.1 hypothetical protein SARC_01448 [Sphaeroforma arctica JP610]|eukprot:XP_014160300.1 hypothetical protein SARC_01448 [Sphaeroforma arctica JP610]
MSPANKPALEVPVIDVSVLLKNADEASPEDLKICADELKAAVSSIGVFRISGHGISNEDQTDASDAVKSLFNVSEAEKHRLSVKANNIKSAAVARGYIGIGEESGSHRVEVKEGFSMGYRWDAVEAGFTPKPMGTKTRPVPETLNALQAVNVWPTEDHLDLQSRISMDSLFEHMTRVSQALVRGFSMAMGEEAGYLTPYCKGGENISLLRLFHYFPYSQYKSDQSVDVERIGSSPHTDWGFLTLIMEPGIGGLEVFHDGEWNTVPPVPGTLVCNVGDYFSMLTNGKFVSPLHKVVTGDEERYSIVYFYYPGYNSHIPQQTCSQDQEVPSSIRDGLKSYSLVTDQSANGADLDQSESITLDDVPFGTYIARKWEQVAR